MRDPGNEVDCEGDYHSVDGKYFMRFQVETSVFKFLRISVAGPKYTKQKRREVVLSKVSHVPALVFR